MQGKENSKQFKLRLPEELHSWVTISAQKNHRSLNSEVNFILEQYKKQEESKNAEQ